METTDTTRAKTTESADGETSRGGQGDGARGTRRKLDDQQEREVTRLYAETETPVSEISKRFGIGESSVYRVAQRHGAALRGRTATSSSPSSPAAAATQPAAGPGRRRGRAPGSAAKTAAKTSTGATPGAAATPSTNGRRTGAKRAAAGAATPARRTAATTTRGTRAPRGTRAAIVAVARREFRVSYTAVRVFVAENMADAIRQAEAAGATDITGIERSS